MAILALASDREDLRARLARIVIGQDRKGNPVRAADLSATGPIDGAAQRGATAESGADDGGNSGDGALRAVCQYRPRDELCDLAEDGLADGRLRRE